MLTKHMKRRPGKSRPPLFSSWGRPPGAPHLRSQDRIGCRRFMIVVIRRLAEPVPSVARPGPVWRGPAWPSGIAYTCHPDRKQGACHAWYRTYSLSMAPLLSPIAAGRPDASRSLLFYYPPAPGQGCQQCDRVVIPSWSPCGASLSVTTNRQAAESNAAAPLFRDTGRARADRARSAGVGDMIFERWGRGEPAGYRRPGRRRWLGARAASVHDGDT